MNHALDDIDYDTKDFNFDPNHFRHPSHITDRQVQYHLVPNSNFIDSFNFHNHNHNQDEASRNEALVLLRHPYTGEPIRSPRTLQQICFNYFVCETFPHAPATTTVSSNAPTPLLHHLDNRHIPAPCYPPLLSEAILFREPRSIERLVSTWPFDLLRIVDYIPLEDAVVEDYLTLPFEGHDDVTLVDCIVLGLLKLTKTSLLKRLDFSGFGKDRRLCKELSRLPILWMRPKERTVDKLHDCMSAIIEISKDKLNSFLNRIVAVYSNIDAEFLHGNCIDPIIIETDMHINIDDVPIGLSLQHLTPFNFKSSKIWMKPLPDVRLPLDILTSVLDPRYITHFEYEDATLPYDSDRQTRLYIAINHLTSLVALSLPGCIDAATNGFMLVEVACRLQSLQSLRRINLSYCHLRGNLENLLKGLNDNNIEHLTLKDCRLNDADLLYMLSWKPLRMIRELNLSCNNLKDCEQIITSMVSRMQRITCFSISFCSLTINSQISILRQFLSPTTATTTPIKIICIQDYIPPSRENLVRLLEETTQMPSLQRAIIFPEAYAFPGDDEQERKMNKLLTLSFSYGLLRLNGRGDLRLE